MLSSLFCVFSVLAVLTGLESVIPLHVERTFGWSTEGAGLIFLGLSVPIFLTPIIGKLHGRFGPHPLSIIGLVIITAAGLLLAMIRSHSVTLIALLVVYLVAIGTGITLVMTPEMAEISAFGEKKAKEEPEVFGQGATAQCCALMTIANSLGGVVGPVVIGHVKAASGWIPASITVGAFGALGLVVLVLLMAYDKSHGKEKVVTKQPPSRDEEKASVETKEEEET
ncbi:hypothetical protein PT974_02222 [Cladobotryum mycophilum]|uniref:Major facilitator superfamily (MFS) profile domain-containing protein n=1 Tax=Cladobotryum mycophilum TaxID=491253 RepID=A0ABR0SYP3_9HYPO